MKTIKGPAIFLAQFIEGEGQFSSLENLCIWAEGMGYKGVQLPTWEKQIFDVEKAAESKDYCDEIKGVIENFGLQITELSSHIHGQMVAVHPAYNQLFDGFVPEFLRNNPNGRTEWATLQVKNAAKASAHLGLKAHGTFSGSLLWPYMHPWPQYPKGMVSYGFKELATRWLPILNVFDDYGIDVCYEIHPAEDLMDGDSFERFLEATGHHPRVNILYDPSHFVLQQLDYLEYIDFYHDYIKMFHVKDSEFNPTGKKGTFGGYNDWLHRAGRYRSLGDGQVDFKKIFSKLTQYGCDLWAVLEWECCIKSPEQGAREGAPFIQNHIIEATNKRFDDFAGVDLNDNQFREILGLNQ